MSERIPKVNQLIKQEVSKLIKKEIDFADILVTVTKAETSLDLKHSKISVIVFPSDKKETALEIINKHIYQIQQILNKKLNMKYVPKLRFEIDKLESRAQRIEELLSKENLENDNKL